MATALRGTRWAMLCNPADQSGDQRTTVAALATITKPLSRGYLLQGRLRMVFEAKGQRGRALSPWPPSPEANAAPNSPDDHEIRPTE